LKYLNVVIDIVERVQKSFCSQNFRVMVYMPVFILAKDDPKRRYLETSKMEKLLRWKTKVDLERG